MLKTLVFAFLALGLCSIANARQGRIRQGTPARPREFPYSVSIRRVDISTHVCGGAIISPTLILTAGVCLNPERPERYEIVAGTLNSAEPYPGQQVRTVARMVVHPNYTLPPYDDIGLIFLNEPYDFDENVSAIKLPAPNQETYPYPVTVSGWGTEQYGLPLSDVLLKVTLDTYTDDYCGTFMNQPVPQGLLCAGTEEGGLSTCAGDAGAPMVAQSTELYLAAVTSHFGCEVADCCGLPGPLEHSPEVAYYLDWIQEQSNLYGGGL